jgi:hypothetical protein
MIRAEFGPIPDGLSEIIDFATANGGNELAQSIYDVRASDLYAHAILSQGETDGVPDSRFTDELRALQHAVWDGKRMAGLGLLMSKEDVVLIPVFRGLSSRIAKVEPLSEDYAREHYAPMLAEAGVKTFGGLEYSIGLSENLLLLSNIQSSSQQMAISKKPNSQWPK